jgi:hypothetical protein
MKKISEFIDSHGNNKEQVLAISNEEESSEGDENPL